MLGVIRSIQRRRKALRLSQQDVARLSGLAQSNYAKIELGKIEPRIGTLVDIARALQLEIMLVPAELLPVVQSLTSEQPRPEERPLFAATGDE